MGWLFFAVFFELLENWALGGSVGFLKKALVARSQLVGHLSAVVETVCARKESGEEEE